MSIEELCTSWGDWWGSWSLLYWRRDASWFSRGSLHKKWYTQNALSAFVFTHNSTCCILIFSGLWEYRLYVISGPNPLFGGLKSTKSIFGESSHTWVEGEGMLHAVYFTTSSCGNNWTLTYKNRDVESLTFKMEKLRQKPAFLPEAEGDPWAIMAAYFLNFVCNHMNTISFLSFSCFNYALESTFRPHKQLTQQMIGAYTYKWVALWEGRLTLKVLCRVQLRFGMVNKHMSNTNMFDHAGKIYVIAGNHVPQEVDLQTLDTLGDWQLSRTWNQPSTSHPKVNLWLILSLNCRIYTVNTVSQISGTNVSAKNGLDFSSNFKL